MPGHPGENHMLLGDILKIVHALAPPHLAAEWDNCGLQLGDLGQKIKRIGLALDATLETVAHALNNQCDLLLVHHPLFFKPIKSINLNKPQGAIVAQAMAGQLAIIAAHTNWDSAIGGMAHPLANLLGLKACRPLSLAGRKDYKLIVFVPVGHEERLRQALFDIGAGAIGAYKDCWFQS
ncbi:MAG: Nif3-like dinuclear metal center hexameric protein, partial [Candidatus Adiutrix sp.]